MNWFDDIKRCKPHYELSPIQKQAVEIDLCPVCHEKKALEQVFNGNKIKSKICKYCNTAFIYDDKENYYGKPAPN